MPSTHSSVAVSNNNHHHTYMIGRKGFLLHSFECAFHFGYIFFFCDLVFSVSSYSFSVLCLLLLPVCKHIIMRHILILLLCWIECRLSPFVHIIGGGESIRVWTRIKSFVYCFRFYFGWAAVQQKKSVLCRMQISTKANNHRWLMNECTINTPQFSMWWPTKSSCFFLACLFHSSWMPRHTHTHTFVHINFLSNRNSQHSVVWVLFESLICFIRWCVSVSAPFFRSNGSCRVLFSSEARPGHSKQKNVIFDACILCTFYIYMHSMCMKGTNG